MKENRLLFTNALIVLPTETIKGSLAVEDGKITGIFESGTELPGFTEVDVHGKALMPGAIDTEMYTMMSWMKPFRCMRKIHMGQPKWPVRSWFAITVWTAFRCV